jgi:hypothetical protein
MPVTSKLNNLYTMNDSIIESIREVDQNTIYCNNFFIETEESLE